MSLFNLQQMAGNNDKNSSNSNSHSDSDDESNSSSNQDNRSESNQEESERHKTDHESGNQNTNNNINKSNPNQISTNNITTHYNPISMNQSNPRMMGLEALLANKENLSFLLKSLFRKMLEVNEPELSYQILYDRCSSLNHIFVDEWFPPNENSLMKGYHSHYPIISELQKHWKEIGWIRQTDIQKQNEIFLEYIEPGNVKPGIYSNPNFVSVIAALAEDYTRIKKLFITDIVNDYGIYAVKICKDGELKEIVVDDFFPVDHQQNLCFSSDNENTLWVQILEKCYAKAYGSYNLIHSKQVEGILRDLTYAPSLTLDNSNDNLIDELVKATQQKWIILASAGETDASHELLKEIHLNPEYDYAIVQVYIIPAKETTGSLSILPANDDNYRTLLKIRNLWSKIEWIGDWSAISNFWNDKQKEKVNYDPNDKCFYMNLKDFKHYFSKIKICKHMNDYYYKSLRLMQKPEEYSLVHVTIDNSDSSSNFYISFVQQDQKNFVSNDYNYGISRIILSRLKDNGEIEYIEGKMGQEREIFLEMCLESGEYLVFAELTKISVNMPYVISVYSNEEVEMKQISNESYPNILEKIYISCAKIQNHVSRLEQEGAPECYKYTSTTVEGYTYIYFENNEADATLIEDVKYTRFEGLKLLKPYSGTSFRVEVGPGQNQIVLIKHLELNEFSLIFSYQSSIQFGKDTLIRHAQIQGIKKPRKDKRTDTELDIEVYIYKHTFGLCYYYENHTTNYRLKETLNIANNTNVDFVGEKEGTTEMTIYVEPGKTYFIELRGKNNLWKVQPLITYTVELLNPDI